MVTLKPISVSHPPTPPTPPSGPKAPAKEGKSGGAGQGEGKMDDKFVNVLKDYENTLQVRSP